MFSTILYSIDSMTQEPIAWPNDSSERLNSSLSLRYQSLQSMIVNYALGVGIIGLIPSIPTITLGIAIALNLKMLWDIGRKWRFSRGNSIVAIAGYAFNLLGALAMGVMAWLTLTFSGAFFPVLSRFAWTAAFMTFTWIVGSATNQFLLQGYLRRYAMQEERGMHG